MKNFLLRAFGWSLAWIIGSFILAVAIGSTIWFIAGVFGADWNYFTYIRGWFIALLVLDLLIDMYRFGTKDGGFNSSFTRRNRW